MRSAERERRRQARLSRLHRALWRLEHWRPLRGLQKWRLEVERLHPPG